MSLISISIIIALLFCVVAPIVGYIKIGLPPVLIIGGSAIVAFFFWYFTYLYRPTDPKIILPLFLLTVAGLQIHIIEEYLTGFAPCMSRLFKIHWTERSFLLIFALVGPTIYTLTAFGLYYQVPLAGFFAWFIFIGPGVMEFTHFIFPLFKPKLEPGNPESISRDIDGVLILNMHNHYYKTMGRYYFPGMWTALLPMIPGIYALFILIK